MLLLYGLSYIMLDLFYGWHAVIAFLTMPILIQFEDDFLFIFKDTSLIIDFEDITMSKCTVLFICFLVAHRYIRLCT